MNFEMSEGLCMTLRLRAVCCLTVLLVPFISTVRGDVRLPGFMSSHMVLQRDQPIPVWGWADPNEPVEVHLGEASATTTANAQGAWRVSLPAHAAGGPAVLTVSGKPGSPTLKLDDILFGDVWLCSGQSNMEWVVANCDNAATEIAAANFPQIRHIKIPKTPSATPQENVASQWLVCTPENVGGFTAAGFFMARKLNQELNIPIGLLHSSWGGTRIEPWTPPVGFTLVPELKSLSEQIEQHIPGTPAYEATLGRYIEQVEAWVPQAKAAQSSGQAVPMSPPFPDGIKPLATHTDPTALYNGMIHPFVGWPLRGAIWYQGESNSSEGMLYRAKMEALIAGWRKIWGIGDFPFYFVQIAPYQYGTAPVTTLPEFWEAQAASTRIPNTGMVVTSDIGNVNDIHPRNKQDVGLRLALLALHRTYGQADVVDSGPEFDSLKTEGDRLIVTFKNTAGGLKSRDGKPLTWFEIIGKDLGWKAAQAEISGDSLILSAPDVHAPSAVRFAWNKLAEPNLTNGAGLPASAFRAGKVPKLDFLSQIEAAQGYELVYDLDLNRLGKKISYDIDHHAEWTRPFDRVGYLLELQPADGPARYVFASMDAFTTDISKIGVPEISQNVKFQQRIQNLHVTSNVTELPQGAILEGGNIEFWPHNYGPTNSANVPGASNTTYDFGDEASAPIDGYGCMQVHSYKDHATIFALNHWASGASADIGIGNSPGQHSDWTFSGNGGTYSAKRLRVFVHPAAN
jgi:sialate O-acetylesterase